MQDTAFARLCILALIIYAARYRKFMRSSLCINNESSTSRQHSENKEHLMWSVDGGKTHFAGNANFPRARRLPKVKFREFLVARRDKASNNDSLWLQVCRTSRHNSRLTVKQLPRLQRCSDATCARSILLWASTRKTYGIP